MIARRRAPVTFEQLGDGSVTLQPADLPTWQQYLTDFDTAVSETNTALQQLEATTPPTDPTARAEYDRLLSAGQDALAKLEALQSTRDSVAAWASGAYSGAVDYASRNIIEPAADVYGSAVDTTSRAIEDVANWFSSRSSSSPTVQGLGFVPLVIVGVGLAAFGAAVYAAIQWAEQVQRFRQLDQMAKAGGSTPEAYSQAARTLNYVAGPPSSGGLLSNLGTTAIWAGAAIIAVVWLVPKLLELLEGRSRRSE